MTPRVGPSGRRLAVEGLHNARDLGGLALRGGGSTPGGVLFRSENLDPVTESGWQELRAAGIRTVVDLRQPAERRRDARALPDWVRRETVDLDGLDDAEFWADYLDNGLIGTARYFLPHLTRMPERAGAALRAVVAAIADGGVLFHCMSGRDRTGMISMLLLTAVGVEPEEIVADYLASVANAGAQAAATGRENPEPTIDRLLAEYGTTTEAAFREALAGLDLAAVLTGAGFSATEREALATWGGRLPQR